LIIEDLCEYGCKQEAAFTLSNGKRCCSKSFQSCPAIREKNTKGLRKAHAEGKMVTFNDVQRIKSNQAKIWQAIPKAFKKFSRADNNQLKHYMTRYLGFFYRCDMCHIDSWQNQPIGLELDHIDGNNTNNELSNLRLLCPNCHSQTGNYKGRNINTGKVKVTDEKLLELISQGYKDHTILKMLKLSAGSGNYSRINKLRNQAI
jgi:Zn finger protein HypA/HybF involved in hydrogenase expression